jgi:hypothetical protein
MLFEVGSKFLGTTGLRWERQTISEHPAGLSSQGIGASLTIPIFSFIKPFTEFVNLEVIMIFSYLWGHEHR